MLMTPKSNSSKIAVAGNGGQLVDEDTDRERRISCGSQTRHQEKSDEVNTELREEYAVPTHRQRETSKFKHTT